MMQLSSELISQFVKVTKDSTDVKTETTVYGTTVAYNDSIYVKIDGSDLLTPIETTANIKPDQRVIVMIKDHTAIVTGNISSPSASSDDVNDINDKVDNIGSKITEFEIVIADKVSVEALEAEIARIDDLVAENVIIKETLTANKASIDDLEADNVIINEKLEANEADITKLKTDKLDAEIADITFATIKDLEATDAEIHNLKATYGEFEQLTTDKFKATDADIDDLKANKLSVTDAEIKYANIDFSNIGKAAIEEFFAKSGMISDLVVGEGTITGTLVGVTIKGDLIEGGTVVADKLVVKGEDGLYYKLNTDGVTTEAEQTEYNSLNGSVITAKSITATKISVNDLVAFDATIGGFNITDSSIYSGVKNSVNNTTRGVYQDSEGQFNVGDVNNFIKFYKDEDGIYKLEISANSLKFGASNKNLEDEVNDLNDKVDDTNSKIDNISDGRNLIVQKTIQNDRQIYINTEHENYYNWNSGEYVENSHDSQNNQLIYEKDSSYFCRTYYIINSNYNDESNYCLSINKSVASVPDYDDIVIGCSESLIGGLYKGFINVFDFIRKDESLIYASFTIPKDLSIVSIFVSFPKRFLGKIKLERGLTPSGYSLAPEDTATSTQVSQEIGAIDIGVRNLIVLNTLTEGYKIGIGDDDDSDRIIADELYSVTDFIPVDPNSDYMLTIWKDNPDESLKFGCSWFNSDYVGVSKLNNTLILEKGIPKTLSPISSASYIRISFPTDLAGYIKFEKGNKVTDMSPAPEDMATGDELDSVKENVNNNSERISISESTIQQLSDSISMLVTDENGESMMTQTSDGWTFNMGSINTTLTETKDTLNELSDSVDEAKNTIENVNSLVDDLAQKTAYIIMTTDDSGAPCIELGKEGNPFKVRITNTSVEFLDGSSKVAYITNKTLYIEKAIIKNELQIGEGTGFVWKKRSNGNMGLRWVGE